MTPMSKMNGSNPNKGKVIVRNKLGWIIADFSAQEDFLTREQQEANAQLFLNASKYEKALIAIAARIQGDLDNPALIQFGTPTNEPEEDITRIIESVMRHLIKGKISTTK